MGIARWNCNIGYKRKPDRLIRHSDRILARGWSIVIDAWHGWASDTRDPKGWRMALWRMRASVLGCNPQEIRHDHVRCMSMLHRTSIHTNRLICNCTCVYIYWMCMCEHIVICLTTGDHNAADPRPQFQTVPRLPVMRQTNACLFIVFIAISDASSSISFVMNLEFRFRYESHTPDLRNYDWIWDVY